jgi:alpha-D-ribose 1-methylphosphonate 5-phosphate C-P lyase
VICLILFGMENNQRVYSVHVLAKVKVLSNDEQESRTDEWRTTFLGVNCATCGPSPGNVTGLFLFEA